MLLALSSRWSLDAEQAQHCVAEATGLVTSRRGHTPHVAVLTMAPRPAMLRLLAYESGAVDCVYHRALDEVRRSADQLADRRGERWPPRASLERMVAQRRLRPYRDLVAEVLRLPRWG